MRTKILLTLFVVVAVIAVVIFIVDTLLTYPQYFKTEDIQKKKEETTQFVILDIFDEFQIYTKKMLKFLSFIL